MDNGKLACADCGGINLDKDCVCGGSGLLADQLRGLHGCIQYWRELHRKAQQERPAALKRAAVLTTENDQLRSALEDATRLLKMALESMPNGAFRNAVWEEELPRLERVAERR